MATFTFGNGSLGASRFDRWNNYDDTVFNENQVNLIYDEETAGEPYDATRVPFKIKAYFEDTEFFVPEEGPLEGEELFVGGVMDEIRFFNENNDLILQVTDFEIPLSVIQGWLAYEDEDPGRFIFQYLEQLDNTYTGATNNDPAYEDPFGDTEDHDDIRTGLGDDTVNAKGGDDFIMDARGADDYNGGNGEDHLYYGDIYWNPWYGTTGITVDLEAGTIVGPDGETDTVRNIERITGTHFEDSFTGDRENNVFIGLNGADYFHGKGGFDVVSYRDDVDQGGFAGIRADIEAGTVRDGFGNIDTMRGVEGVEGTDFRDIMDDDERDNYLRGRGGDDKLRVSEGDDYLEGNSGADMFVFRGNDVGDNNIVDFNSLEGDTIKITKLVDIEDLTFTDEAGEGVLIEFAQGSIFLENVYEQDLTASDFGFDLV